LPAVLRCFIAAYQLRENAFDQTYYDLAVALSANPLRESGLTLIRPLMTPLKKALADATVSLENDQFYVELPEGKLQAQLVSEGYRKLASLLYLLNNGSLAPDGILFWDEPETNLNPRMVTNVVEALNVLSSAGIQIFITTHDYLLSQELSLEAEYSPEMDIRFFALYRPKPKAAVQFDEGHSLVDIKNNPILEEFAAHYDREARYFQTSKE
jgi:predicted ATPase